MKRREDEFTVIHHASGGGGGGKKNDIGGGVYQNQTRKGWPKYDVTWPIATPSRAKLDFCYKRFLLKKYGRVEHFVA